ncbi:MAG: tail fiber protein [Bacteroidia bacterium]
MFAAPFAPRNWAYCQGQILAISSNTALFSLLGTTYGGNGIQTFALPNFASRTGLGTGQGAGLSLSILGEVGGIETVTLTSAQIPSHNHTGSGNVSLGCDNVSVDESNPAGEYPGISNSTTGNLYSTVQTGNMGTSNVNITVQPSGGSVPHSNLQPYLGMNYIICMYGIFPSRN